MSSGYLIALGLLLAGCGDSTYPRYRITVSAFCASNIHAAVEAGNFCYRPEKLGEDGKWRGLNGGGSVGREWVAKQMIDQDRYVSEHGTSQPDVVIWSGN